MGIETKRTPSFDLISTKEIHEHKGSMASDIRGGSVSTLDVICKVSPNTKTVKDSFIVFIISSISTETFVS